MRYLAVVISMLPGLVGMIRDQAAARYAARRHAEQAAITRREHRARLVRRYMQAR